jgi:signal transduction histidine kinase
MTVNSSRPVRPVAAGRAAFYRLFVDKPASAREVAARTRAKQRHRRQRDILRPLGALAIAAAAVSAINGHPAPAAHGAGLGVVAALAVFAATLAYAVRATFVERSTATQAIAIGLMGAAGIALVALQPRGATELAGGAAVWFAIARLPLVLGLPLAGATTLGLGSAEALSGGSASAVVAGVLLCALLALVAYFIKQARASQEMTELLLARLEDAREQQLEAAAVAERARIAGELHDVLAHSLSGAAIQLEGARKLAEVEQASARVQAAIQRAGELVRDGLANARHAVNALRGDELPNITQLDSLIAAFRADTHADVTLTVEGNARPLSPEASLALYRGAQEALTNIARYAPGAPTAVLLRYDRDRTSLTVDDRPAESRLETAGLNGVGGGNGLAAMRERLERLGGTMQAGPVDSGWRVRLDVPG